MVGLFALLFELVNLHIHMLDLFLKFAFPPLKGLYFRFGRLLR